jgi:hypothetical protein
MGRNHKPVVRIESLTEDLSICFSLPVLSTNLPPMKDWTGKGKRKKSNSMVLKDAIAVQQFWGLKRVFLYSKMAQSGYYSLTRDLHHGLVPSSLSP